MTQAGFKKELTTLPGANAQNEDLQDFWRAVCVLGNPVESVRIASDNVAAHPIAYFYFSLNQFHAKPTWLRRSESWNVSSYIGACQTPC